MEGLVVLTAIVQIGVIIFFMAMTWRQVNVPGSSRKNTRGRG